MALIHEAPAYGFLMNLREPAKQNLAANGIDVDGLGYVFERDPKRGLYLIRQPETTPSHRFQRVTIRGVDAQIIYSFSPDTQAVFAFANPHNSDGAELYTARVRRDGMVEWLVNGNLDEKLGKGYAANIGMSGRTAQLTYVTFKPSPSPTEKHQETTLRTHKPAPDAEPSPHVIQATRALLVKAL